MKTNLKRLSAVSLLGMLGALLPGVASATTTCKKLSDSGEYTFVGKIQTTPMGVACGNGQVRMELRSNNLAEDRCVNMSACGGDAICKHIPSGSEPPEYHCYKSKNPPGKDDGTTEYSFTGIAPSY